MTELKENLEQLLVSFYLNVKAEKHSDMQIGRVLRGIKNEAYFGDISHARHFLSLKEEEKYKETYMNGLSPKGMKSGINHNN